MDEQPKTFGTGLVFDDIRDQEARRINSARSRQDDLKHQIGACRAVQALGQVQAFQAFIEKVQALSAKAETELVSEPDVDRMKALQGRALCYREMLAIMRDQERVDKLLSERLAREVEDLERVLVKQEGSADRVAPGRGNY